MSWNPADAVAAGRRTAGRMTQTQLAEKLTELTGKKWTRDMVAALESGRKTFDVDTLTAVVSALGVTVEYILFGDRVNPRYRDSRRKVSGNHSPLGLATHPTPLLAA